MILRPRQHYLKVIFVKRADINWELPHISLLSIDTKQVYLGARALRFSDLWEHLAHLRDVTGQRRIVKLRDQAVWA